MRIVLLTLVLALRASGATPASRPAAERPADVPNVVGRLANDWRWDLAGDALWLPERSLEPGLVGRVCYVHATPWPGLYSFEVRDGADDRPARWSAMAHEWTPAGTRTEFSTPVMLLTEESVITRYDVAASRYVLQNNSGRELTVHITVRPLVGEGVPAEDLPDALTGPATCTLAQPGLPPLPLARAFCLRGTGLAASAEDGALHADVVLAGSSTATFTVGMALRGDAGECRRQIAPLLQVDSLLAANAERENAWYAEQTPRFECSDPLIEKTYLYRWYVVRRNSISPALAAPGHPDRHPCVYEGRSSDWLARMTGRALPLQLLETRWLRSPDLPLGLARDIIERRQGEAQGGWGFDDLNWVSMGLWRLHLVQPDGALLASAYPGAERQVRSMLSPHSDPDGDMRPDIAGSFVTGMEYSPSFFYFTTPRWDHTWSEEFGRRTSLERVDEQCYLHLDTVAAACMARALGRDKDADSLERTASAVREATLSALWDPADRFFYSIEPTTHQPARVREWVGYLPFMAAVAGPEHVAAFDRLEQPEEFATAWPVPTTSVSSPAFSPDGSWTAGPNASPERPYGARGWNGPNRPAATCMVADAVAVTCRLANHDERLAKLFAHLFERYTALHYQARGTDCPLIVDGYNPITGAPIGREADHFRSIYIDLVIRHVCGLQPRPDNTLLVDPIDIGLAEFSLHGAPYQGHSVDILWSQRGGLRVNVDGTERARQPGLSPAVSIEL